MAITTRLVCPVSYPGETNAPSPANEVPRDRIDYQRAHYLARRLRVALFDLGLEGVLPSTGLLRPLDGLALGNLTFKQADALGNRPGRPDHRSLVNTPTPGPDQLSFFGGALR